MMDREDLAWAAGFFEGEGCINRRKTQNFIAINNTDLSMLQKFHQAVGVGVVRGPYGPYRNGLSKKPYWTWSVCNFQGRQAVIAMLWHWLSERRRVQVSDVLQKA